MYQYGNTYFWIGFYFEIMRKLPQFSMICNFYCKKTIDFILIHLKLLISYYLKIQIKISSTKKINLLNSAPKSIKKIAINKIHKKKYVRNFFSHIKESVAFITYVIWKADVIKVENEPLALSVLSFMDLTSFYRW